MTQEQSQPHQRLEDDVVILRRIPEKVASAKPRHFKLRKDIAETGISCNRLSEVDPPTLLEGQKEGSWLAKTTVGQIRKIGLDIEIDEVEGSPGHCEIRSSAANLDDQLVRDDLANIFEPL